MALVQWDPWHEIDDMFDRYTRMVGLPRRGAKRGMVATDWSPQVDILESPEAFTIKAELPEINKDDVKISVDNGILTLQGERKQEKEEKGRTFHRIERFYGQFSRSFTLPDNVDANAIKAAFKDGVLSLQLPKTAGTQPKAIEVKVA